MKFVLFRGSIWSIYSEFQIQNSVFIKNLNHVVLILHVVVEVVALDRWLNVS